MEQVASERSDAINEGEVGEEVGELVQELGEQ